MRSIRALVRPRADSPVPLASRTYTVPGFSWGGRGARSREQHLRATASSGTLYAILDALATAVSSVEWKLYRLGPDGQSLPDDERVEVTRHAALDLIRKPNPFMTGNNLRERGQQHIDLTGEAWAVILRKGGLPLELWPVMPHRIEPVPHPVKFLSGYIYTDPDGQRIPLDVSDVLSIQRPNPHDFYRGLGPLDAIGTDVEAAEYAAAWNRNYFLNSAEPGGVIEIGQGLSETQFQDLKRHWDESHRGVDRAHRVAILEYGKWVDTARSQRDMQFAELRQVSRDVLMEAFRMSKVGLGITDDVNRASALAAESQFAKLLTVPRLERWRTLYNDMLLPQYYRGGRPNVEFDYVSPVGEDDEAANAARDSKVNAAAKLLAVPGVQFDVTEVLEAFDLPPLTWEKVEVPAPLTPGAQANDDPAGEPEPPVQPEPPAPPAQPENRVRAADEGAPERDLSGHQAAWTAALDALLAQFETVLAGWRGELRQQIIDADSVEELAALAITDTALAVQFLAERMTALAASSAQDVADEAAEQGVQVAPAEPEGAALEAMAVAAVALLAGAYALSASREAVRLHGENLSGTALAGKVLEFLGELGDRAQRDHLGGALSGAQNAGRIETYRQASTPSADGKPGPVGSIYADETLDENTCAPCRAVNGRFICTTEDLGPAERLYTAAGGYVGCLGGVRCRGTVTGVWRPATTGDDQ